MLAAGAAVPVHVVVADQAAAKAAGVRGVVLQVSRADGKTGVARAGLSVGYGKFADAYGASYGNRLQLMSLPDCALTTPSLPRCQTQIPIASANDPATQTVAARSVPVSGSSMLVALSTPSDGSSSEASWTATDLSQAYSWASGTSGGDFTMNYPIKVPASLGGPAPQLAFAYSSGSVDGKTAAKTGQASVVGEGWDLPGGGYIERSFRSCADDGGTTADNCWFSADVMTMVFGGRSTKLFQDSGDAGHAWHTVEDDGLRIDRFFDSTATHNTALDGEYWRVTTQDGTQYYFGKMHRYLGDTAGGARGTGSVLTEPVIGNQGADPCAGNPNSVCQQAYRWNLDYVVDPRGNSMTYFYDVWTGRYGFNNNQQVMDLDVSSRLNRIEYGTRAGSEASSTAPMQVVFDYAERCFNNCSWPASGYSDTPTDLYCDAAATTCPNVVAPVHFTRYRLAGVRTQVYTGSAYRNVDKWDLDQTFLTSGDSNGDGHDDTAPNLALNGLVHTGYAADGTTGLAEPETTFGYTRLANRTDWSPAAGTAPFNHWRISQINNGVGGQTLVSYLGTDCVNGGLKINSDSNPFRCFPQYYKPPSAPAGFGYFNKYVVQSVTEQDLTGPSPDEVTSYSYSTDGSSDTALWAHDDVDIANIAQTSWGGWRGYPTVTVTHGAVTGQQTVTKTVYYRGLTGDAKKSGDDTAVQYAQRTAFTLEPLQTGANNPIGLAGGGGGGAGTGATCVDIQGAGTADATPLQENPCNATVPQYWVRGTDSSGSPILKNPNTNKCMDVQGSVAADGTPVQLFTCNNTAAQVWMRQPDGQLRNPLTGRCLDVAGSPMTAGHALRIWTCGGSWHQVYMPTARSELVITQNMRCATMSGTTDGSGVGSQVCGYPVTTANQTWQLQGDGSVVNPGTGKCMTVQGGGTANNTLVVVSTCNQSTGQKWTAQADGTLKNPNSSRCLDAEGDGTLYIYDCTARLSQRWLGRSQDNSAFTGQARASYTLDNGTVNSVTFHRYTNWVLGSRAAYANPGTGSIYYSQRQRETTTKNALWIPATSSWRWSETDTTFDSYGDPTDVNDLGDPGTTADDTCTHTDYARNTSTYLVSFPSQTVTTDCAASPHDGNYLAGTQMLYDGSTTLGAAPGQGLPTQNNALTGATGTTLVWTKQGRTTYDSNGRLQDTFDALEHKTMTRYTPATGGPVTGTTVTNPLGHVKVTTTEPGHGTSTSVLDANNQTTTAAYDPLGRLSTVWLPGRATNLSGNFEYTYALNNAAPNAVTSKKLGPNGNQVVSTVLYDGRLRVRQTQTAAAQAKGGRIIADTQYDARGLAWQQTTFWDATTAPGAALAGFSNTGVNQQTRTTFDSLQRPTAVGLYAANVLQWQTTTSYDGNTTTVIPPAGGIPSRQTVDVAGHVTALRQYTAGSVSGAYQDTTYTFDRLGHRTKITDPASNQWTTTYDRLGRVTASTDPDSGGTSASYDDAGRVITSTDARGITLAYKYDDLNRKIDVYDNTTSGTKRAEWVYDTVRKGALTSATRYVSGVSYTTTVDSYDVQGRPLSTSTSLPLVANAPTGNYTTTATYNVDGSLATTTYPAAGGLPQETVSTTYDATGRPLSVTGLDTYIADTSYYGFGPAYQQVLGSGTKKVRNTSTIDETTGRLTGALTETQNQTNTNNWDQQLNQAYTYDPTGNLTSAKETNAGTVVADECFKYDGLRELTEAWTTTATTCQATPSMANVGGTDAYWTSYQYQMSTGNRGTETKHATAGDTTRTYTYPNSGSTSVRPHTITSIASTGAVTSTDSYTYDNSGDTATRSIATGPNQTMVWDNEDHLSTVTDTTGTTKYTYDADGVRLIAADPQGTTAYLAGFELRTQSGATTATRYYNGIAVRTTGGLTWLATDQHGTGTLTINATTLTTTRRRLDPYGNPRTTTAVAWPGNRGFVNGTLDNTGLTHIGAREYEPTTGRFISDDPVTDPADPQQLNGYSYAANNPTTGSDPTGLRTCSGPDDCAGDDSHGNPSWGNGATPQSSATNPPGKKICPGSCHIPRPVIVPVVTPPAGNGPSQEDIDKANKIKQQSVLDTIISVGGQIILDLLGVTDAINCFTKGDIGACVSTVLNVIPWGQIFKAAKIGEAAWRVGRAVVRFLGEAKWAERVLADAEKVAVKAKDACELVPNSFRSDTPVLMADGTRKPISEVKVGDQVLSADPASDTTQPRSVMALHRNLDTTLTELKVTSDGHQIHAINTTWEHPFWSDSRQRWVNAGALQGGEHLRALDGENEIVVSRSNSIGNSTMYNLTVAVSHTYYIVAGSTPVLVHNADFWPAPSIGPQQNPSLGSTARREPVDWEKDLLGEVRANPEAGSELWKVPQTDARWPRSEGWRKMEQTVDGLDVHYQYNPESGAVDDLKPNDYLPQDGFC